MNTSNNIGILPKPVWRHVSPPSVEYIIPNTDWVKPNIEEQKIYQNWFENSLKIITSD